MTYTEFMEELQKYYGLYPQDSYIPKYLLGYLQRDIDENKLDRLFRFVTYHHPHRFGAPGIAEIEKSISEALYKKRGEDVHKIEMYTTVEIERPNTAEEDELIQRLCNEKGLSKAFRKEIKNKE